jgi:prophage regulatory protein
MDEIDRFVREPECKLITGLSRTTRWRLERQGEFPNRRILSTNAVGWRLSAIEQWLSEREATRPDQREVG